MSLTAIPWYLLRSSPLNPRKTFDADSLADLSESIAANGLLANVVVRDGSDTTGPGTYELVCGERRWRAVGLLVDADRLTETHPIPCRIITCTDAELLKLATAENVARASMTPLEEADAFVRMRELGVPTEEIAKVIGKTQKFVQIRIALAIKAVPEVREALAAGTLSVDAARQMTMAPPERQIKVLTDMREHPNHYATVASVKRALTSGMIPAEIAAFPLALYSGHTITDEDDKLWLTDAVRFERLQLEAATAQAEALRRDEHLPWVRVMDHNKSQSFLHWEWHKVPGHAKAGAIVEIDRDRRVVVHRDLVAPADLAPRSKPKDKSATTADDGPGELTKAHLVACRQQRTLLLQDAVAASPAAALRLAILGMLGADQIKISGMTKDADDRVISPAVLALLESWAQRFPKVLTLTKADASPTATYSSGPLQLARDGYCAANGATQAAAWQALVDLPDAEAADLFAALVAERFGSFAGFNADYGDTDLPVAVAETLSVPADRLPSWRPDEAFIVTLRKPQLVALCQSLGMIDGPAQLKTYTALRTDELRRAILLRADQVTAVLPTMRFGEPSTIEKAAKAWLADPAKAKPARKKRVA